MDILDKIVKQKRKVVSERSELIPIKLLERSIYFNTPAVSLKQYIKREDKSGVIAEIKRQSPSRGLLNPNVSVERISIGYMQGGASALSILTEEDFFGGSNDDLITARKFNYCPILRKDFIIEEYQVIETKSIGADAILLIAACLDLEKLQSLSKIARSLGLEVLIEIHEKGEISDQLLASADLIGVNNRDLKSFEINLQTSKKLSKDIPDDLVKISESGITDPSDILELKRYGFEGFLIGSNFMASARPERACREFLGKLKESSERIKV